LRKRTRNGVDAVDEHVPAARDQLKKLEKTSEDDQKKAEKELQKLHDDYIGRIDELLKGKEAEIMEV
jgi:ribosome recycling factor